MANQSLKDCLEHIRSSHNEALKSTRAKIGFNIYGISVLLREFADQELNFLPSMEHAVDEIQGGNKGTKRRLKIVS